MIDLKGCSAVILGSCGAVVVVLSHLSTNNKGLSIKIFHQSTP